MLPKPPHYNRGFTLVEMLIVIVLVGFLAGMSIPSFIKAQRYAKVTNNSNALYTSLSRARAIAMRKQRPVIIGVVTTTGPGYPILTFNAFLDADYSTNPGFPGATPTAGSGDTALLGTDSPFPNGQLKLEAKDFSFGFPATGTSAFTAMRSNAGTDFWFGFDASGKLIPNGQVPFAGITDMSSLPQNPNTALIGGPEFYFAEAGAASITRASAHTYRKIEINSFGAIRTLAWNAQSNQWKGVQ